MTWLRKISPIFVGLLYCGLALAQVSLPAPFHPCLSAGIKKSVVFLGTQGASANPQEEPEHSFSGTGFLIVIDNIFYLVTAKHVVQAFRAATGTDDRMFAFLNGQDGKLRAQSIAAMKKDFTTDWIFGGKSDLALIPFAIRPDFDVRVVPEAMFLDSTQLLELQDLFFVTYQPGIGVRDGIMPVTRRGMVSVLNADGSFFMDAFTFPGNSGSPVFVRPSPATFVQGGTAIGDPRACQFVGIVGEYLTYQEIAVSRQTNRPRIVFEENTGLARVWPIQALHEIIASPSFRAQHEAVRKNAAEMRVR